MEFVASFCFLMLITVVDSSDFTVFYEHPDLAGKTCKTNAFTPVSGTTAIACASKCMHTASCDSFFYSTSSTSCVGCTETYSSAGQATGTLSGSLYYAKTQPTPPPSYTYLGCYAADCNGQPCNPARLTYNGAMTIEICYNDCLGNTVFAAKLELATMTTFKTSNQQNFLMLMSANVGVQSSLPVKMYDLNVNCFCDPDYSTIDTGCTYNCPGDSSQKCGGTYAMSLFRYD